MTEKPEFVYPDFPETPEELHEAEKKIALHTLEIFEDQPDKIIWYLSLIWELGHQWASNGGDLSGNPYKPPAPNAE